MTESDQTPGAEIHQLRIAPPPPAEQPAKDLVVRIIFRGDGAMQIDADKGIPLPILATLRVVFEDFMRAHLVRGGT